MLGLFSFDVFGFEALVASAHGVLRRALLLLSWCCGGCLNDLRVDEVLCFGAGAVEEVLVEVPQPEGDD